MHLSAKAYELHVVLALAVEAASLRPRCGYSACLVEADHHRTSASLVAVPKHNWPLSATGSTDS